MQMERFLQDSAKFAPGAKHGVWESEMSHCSVGFGSDEAARANAAFVRQASGATSAGFSRQASGAGFGRQASGAGFSRQASGWESEMGYCSVGFGTDAATRMDGTLLVRLGEWDFCIPTLGSDTGLFRICSEGLDFIMACEDPTLDPYNVMPQLKSIASQLDIVNGFMATHRDATGDAAEFVQSFHSVLRDACGWGALTLPFKDFDLAVHRRLDNLVECVQSAERVLSGHETNATLIYGIKKCISPQKLTCIQTFFGAVSKDTAMYGACTEAVRTLWETEVYVERDMTCELLEKLNDIASWALDVQISLTDPAKEAIRADLQMRFNDVEIESAIEVIHGKMMNAAAFGLSL